MNRSLRDWLDKKADSENMALCFDPWQTLDANDDFDAVDDGGFGPVEVWKYFERYEQMGVPGCYMTKPALHSE